jgi:ADP-ribose pyrophosphatase
MKQSHAEAQANREKKSLIDSHWAYQGKVIGLRLDTYELNGKPKIFEIIHHPGAVVIIPVDPKGRLLLVRQWRRAIGQITLELPAGTLEEGEEPLSCAQRELQEEIGFKANKMTPLCGFFSAPGFCDEYLHLFLGEELIESRLPADEDEGIDVVTLDQKEVRRLIEDGKIVDAKSIAGILRFSLWMDKKGIN